MLPPAIDDETVLTRRQAEVLTLRHQGHTLEEIATVDGTSVANISAIEQTARTNIERARRTVTLARFLTTVAQFRIERGTDLREIVDEVYGTGDREGIRIGYTDPELSTRLRTHLEPWVDRRQLTMSVQIGITDGGEVVTYPSAVLEDASPTNQS